MSSQKRKLTAIPVTEVLPQIVNHHVIRVPEFIRRIAETGVVCSLLFAVYLYYKGTLDPRPVTIDIRGPVLTIADHEYWFHVEVAGTTGIPNWKVSPETSGILTPSQDGMKARFQSSVAGNYTIIVSVAGAHQTVSSDVLEFENARAFEDVPPEDIPVVNNDPHQFDPPPPPIQNVVVTSVTELTRQALAEVDDGTKAAGQTHVAGAFRQVINRIQSGQVQPSDDPVALVQEQINLSLGEQAAEGWAIFMVEVRAIFDQLREEGHVTTAASAVNALSEVANELVAVR